MYVVYIIYGLISIGLLVWLKMTSIACWNLNCPNTATGSPRSLLTCSQCGQATYCDKGCQKADWKSRHKKECEGGIVSTIAQAIEISLFGKNYGGKLNDQIKRIQGVLEQTGSELSSADGLSTIDHLNNLLISVFIPPIVEISDRQYAVFTPGVYHGVYATEDIAMQIVTQQYIAFSSNIASVDCGAEGYMHPQIASGDIPRMNWQEHALIAVYVGMYKKTDMKSPDTLKAQEKLLLNKPLSLPRTEIPCGIFLPVLSADKTRVHIRQHQ